MTLTEFINRIKSLHNIDRDMLPELTTQDWAEFRVDPAYFLMRASAPQLDAIWREVEKRQAKAATAETVSDTDLLRGMVGLVEILLGRDDVPVAIRHVLLSNHRIVDARAAVGIRAKSRLVWVTVEISFDTITGWHHELTKEAADKLADRWRSTRAGKVYVRPVEVPI